MIENDSLEILSPAEFERAVAEAGLPATVPTAQLPRNYQAAKQALSECERVDECSQWADQAAALATYARQARDAELEASARRIRARALRRCGELLRAFDARGGDRTKSQGGLTFARSRGREAEDAGISRYKAFVAGRLAAIPEKVFEAAIETDNPPSSSSLMRLASVNARPETKKREVKVEATYETIRVPLPPSVERCETIKIAVPFKVRHAVYVNDAVFSEIQAWARAAGITADEAAEKLLTAALDRAKMKRKVP